MTPKHDGEASWFTRTIRSLFGRTQQESDGSPTSPRRPTRRDAPAWYQAGKLVSLGVVSYIVVLLAIVVYFHPTPSSSDVTIDPTGGLGKSNQTKMSFPLFRAVQHWIEQSSRDRKRRKQERKRIQQETQSPSTSTSLTATPTPTRPSNKSPVTIPLSTLKHYHVSVSEYPKITKNDQTILQDWSTGIHELVSDWDHRVAAVPWGGHVPWWDTTHRHGRNKQSHPFLEQLNGGHLLWSYYRIVQMHMKKHKVTNEQGKHSVSLVSYFPFRLCKAHGCTPPEIAMAHTLEWREKYKPWKVTPSVLKENKSGWIYVRGFARPTLGASSTSSSSSKNVYGRHAMLWSRTGMHKAQDPLAWIRTIIHASDLAVSEALANSHGRVGKFNIVIDATGYQWGSFPSVAYMKQCVTMLQDHFPDRLGLVLIANVSRATEIIINIVKALLTKEVREKIHVLAHDPHIRFAQLEAVVEPEFIPDWLGGKDTYRFDPAVYYPKRIQISEAAGKEFLKTMPYHAT